MAKSGHLKQEGVVNQRNANNSREACKNRGTRNSKDTSNGIGRDDKKAGKKTAESTSAPAGMSTTVYSRDASHWRDTSNIREARDTSNNKDEKKAGTATEQAQQQRGRQQQ